MLSGAGWNDVVCSGSVSIPSLCEMELTCKTSKEVTCPPPTESPPRHCYHPWHKFNDACLIYIPSPLIWNDADKLCGLLGECY